MRITYIMRIALLGCLWLTACGAENLDSKANNASSTDTGLESDASMVVDMGEDASTMGAFEIGWNPVTANTPDAFNPLADGVAIPFVFGVQGSWMVVLAFRTHDLLKGEFEVEAEIAIDGGTPQNIWLEYQETFPGGDGWDYYFNLFLPINSEPPAEGTPLRVTLRVTDVNGTVGEATHDVIAGPADGP